MASGSRKSLKKAQTLLTPPELQGLDAEEIESDNDDDAASAASEQFYENIVCIMYQSIWNLSMPFPQVFWVWELSHENSHFREQKWGFKAPLKNS